MEDFLKTARNQIENLELDCVLREFDLGSFDVKQLKHIDFKGGAESVRQQLQHLDSEKREKDAANEGFFGGIMLGALLGAIIALIFAPRRGDETRQLAMSQINELKNIGQPQPDTPQPPEPAIERVIGNE